MELLGLSELNSLAIPALCSAISVLVIPFQLLSARKREDQAARKPRLNGWSAVKFLGCAILLCISVFEVAIVQTWYGWCMLATYAYGSGLALVATTGWIKQVSRHLSVILFSALAVYTYRDIYPLATYDRVPQDQEGVSWIVKITILAIIGAVIPLFQSSEYIPSDPKFKPSLDQKASWWSLLWLSYLDSFIWSAYQGHGLKDLPSLADKDSAKTLEKDVECLDPLTGSMRKRHIFVGLLYLFRRDVACLVPLLFVVSLTSFLSPIGINRLLACVTGGKGSRFKPWFWILWMLLGPVLSSLSLQRYIAIVCTMVVRIEAIATQLLLRHSLRIRVTVSPSNQKDGELGDRGNVVGKINNLVTSDLTKLFEARDWLMIVTYLPLQIVLCTVFLYKILGWSALLGVASLIVMIPIPGQIMSMMQLYQAEKMKISDARVQLVSETLNMIRMIKLLAWEDKTQEKIGVKREDELRWVWKLKLLSLGNGIFRMVASLLTMVVTFAAHTVLMKQPLNASKVFSSMVVFEVLREQIADLLQHLVAAIQGKVALDRIDHFLKNSEMLDEFSNDAPTSPTVVSTSDLSSDFGIENMEFYWSIGDMDQEQFKLRIRDRLTFQPGSLNLICGETGSGKTALLLALLGELHASPLTEGGWFNLPRDSGVAYAAQDSWVQSGTIKENIIFGSIYDESRYQKVIRQCGLEQDLNLFAAGDATQVGERGITLRRVSILAAWKKVADARCSGGQKARLTLARAVYSSASTLLLDDILAALDVHTAKWVVEKCLSGDLLQGRTVLLVTHNIALIQPIASFVVVLSSEGSVATQGAPTEVFKNSDLLATVQAQEEQSERSGTKIRLNDQEAKDALIVEEESAKGHLTWDTLKFYLDALGGSRPYFFYPFFLVGFFFTDFSLVLQFKVLGDWAQQYEFLAPGDVSVARYLILLAWICVAMIASYSLGNILFARASMRASQSIHQRLTFSLLHTTFRWLDTTPTSRAISRCTQDISSVDNSVGTWFVMFVQVILSMMVRFGALVIVTPFYTIPGAVITILGIACGRVYMQAGLPVKREMSVAKAPVLAHFSSAIMGLTSLRAFGAQDAFRRDLLKQVDRYSRASKTYWTLNCWVTARADFLAAFFTSGVAFYLVYTPRHGSSAETGFSITVAFGFSLLIMFLVRSYNEFELSGNSLERIIAFLHLEQEAGNTPNGRPSAAWPTSSELRVENLRAKYYSDGPEVLHGLSFHIKSGERVGIVGRTGSGKSSLTLSLLRAIPTTGNVYLDGLLTSEINLTTLRSKISIIPQSPDVLTSSLRENLDPFSEFDDANLNDALRAVGLREGKFTLDTQISNSTLSVGERQMVALARTIVRGSKVLILDEATSAIDYTTDAAIQTALRTQLAKDTTVITIAHRLQTIMDADTIIVLEEGVIVEMGSASVLLNKTGGVFRRLVDESSDREELYAKVKA